MKTKIGSLIVILAIVALLIIAVARAAPDAVQFKPVTRDSMVGTLSWLFVVALFIERAVEVIVSVLRDGGASPLDLAVKGAQEKIDEQTRVTPGAVAYLDGLHAAQRKLADYRSETKELALCVSFVLSLFVSLAGVRAFSSIVGAVPVGNWLFAAADIIVTGAVLAGGTDAIHQMLNVFTNFMGAAADKAKGS